MQAIPVLSMAVVKRASLIKVIAVCVPWDSLVKTAAKVFSTVYFYYETDLDSFVRAALSLNSFNCTYKIHIQPE